MLRQTSYRISLKIIFLFGILITLSACIPSYTIKAPTLTKNTVIGPNHGVVRIRVVDASGQVSFPFNKVYIVPKSLNESDEIKPTQLTKIKHASASSIFSSVVETGDYSISGIWSSYSSDTYSYNFGVRADVAFGTFKVIPGKVTDLGTIIYYPKSDGDQYIKTLVRSPVVNDGAVLAQVQPYFNTNQSETLSWEEEYDDTEHRSSYISIAQNPVTYNDYTLLPTGELYIAGKLGAIIVRDHENNWSLDAVDTDYNLNSISVNKNGDLVLGGDTGIVRLKRQSKDWEDYSLPPNYVIDEISFLNDHLINVISHTQNQVRIQRLDINQPSPSWKLLASYVTKGGWSDQNGTNLQLGDMRGSGFRYNIHSIYNEYLDGKYFLFLQLKVPSAYAVFNQARTEIFEFNQHTGHISQANKFGNGVDRLLNAGAVTVGVNKPNAWTLRSSNLYLIRKKNKVWKKISNSVDMCPNLDIGSLAECKIDETSFKKSELFNFYSAPVFFNETEGLAIGKISPPRDSNAKRKYFSFILHTMDSGQTWINTNYKLPAKYCIDLISDLNNTVLLSCKGSSGDFYHSKDRGKTWEHVREHINF